MANDGNSSLGQAIAKRLSAFVPSAKGTNIRAKSSRPILTEASDLYRPNFLYLLLYHKRIKKSSKHKQMFLFYKPPHFVSYKANIKQTLDDSAKTKRRSKIK